MLCRRALHVACRSTSQELSVHLHQSIPKNPTAFDCGETLISTKSQWWSFIDYTHLKAMTDVRADICLTTLAAGSCNSCLIWPSGSVMGPNICSAPPLAFWWRNGWWKYKRTQVDTLIQNECLLILYRCENDAMFFFFSKGQSEPSLSSVPVDQDFPTSL